MRPYPCVFRDYHFGDLLPSRQGYLAKKYHHPFGETIAWQPHYPLGDTMDQRLVFRTHQTAEQSPAMTCLLLATKKSDAHSKEALSLCPLGLSPPETRFHPVRDTL